MEEPQGFINIDKPVAYLRHEFTHSQFAVYKKNKPLPTVYDKDLFRI